MGMAAMVLIIIQVITVVIEAIAIRRLLGRARGVKSFWYVFLYAVPFFCKAF